MPNDKQRVQYPELSGSELHHDLKNDPGKKGDPDHASDDNLNPDDDKGVVGKVADKVKSALSSGSDK